MKILVLMSTYNGSNFIGEQITSIINQKFLNQFVLEFIIRDDGSKDSTIYDIIKIFQSCENENVIYNLISGANIGVKNSFFDLMDIAKNKDFDIGFLADQDDFWLENKVAEVSQCFALGKKPVLYCSPLRVVDSNLVDLSIYRHPFDSLQSGPLLNNFITGCTVAFNKEFLNLYIRPNNVANIKMHDWWLAYVAYFTDAKIIYGELSLIKYRQHGSNVVGAPSLRRSFKKILNIMSGCTRPTRIEQANEFLCVYKNRVSHQYLLILNDFVQLENIYQRIKFLSKHYTKTRWISYATFIFEKK